ncbi:PQQ-binding-like beta-propeller repeat protein [Donghicola tyrosinivorans]|uniref:Outer membrane protein assembly factor BamB n=1 Tax=Donghicola tyrosinivorans TaxID=1652492 RepID=A0A2T0WU46_9RHOB|nr:PQQ-binding-like beta-propeller repeat protein [Donghicola tyrosinivorans]PRY90200.1 outer membrane protein assembly factor BamB [Donghicola tyrosinivorans]
MTICRRSALIAVLATTTLLTACAEPEIILPGDRLTLDGEVPQLVFDDQPRAAAMPAAQNLSAWPQAHVNARNNPGNLSVSFPLTQVMAVNIGQSEDRAHRITAEPVVADGRIFTIDAQATVQATSTSGAVLWTHDLTPMRDDTKQGSGGGLAVDGNVVFAASSFGAITALDTATGAVLWQQELESGASGTPTVYGDLLYFVSGANRAWAIDKSNGRVRWQLDGVGSGASVVGGPAPAVTDQLVIFPFSNGDVMAAFRQGGVRRWDASVAGTRNGLALSQISAITGDPVVDGNKVYISNQSGSLVALELDTGNRVWSAPEGALGPVAVTSDSVYLISDRNELMRLDATDGTRIWGTELPNYQAKRPRRRDAVFAHYGPLLVDGQIVITSSDGYLRSYNAESGALTSEVAINGGAATPPVVVNGTVYVVSRKGQLLAFR